ncbi:PulJ/GspJ family protein [Aeromonas simiae]|uniref:PulJ/GspJ family protein n=1 Tax=Aeromonas simiae TaxID=218936 RepID=UPI0005AB73DD|nr:type II secretion system protein [Aeromonas simiae]
MGRRGFTLVEFILVIVLFGILAIFTSQFVGIGSRLYADANILEQRMSDVRFALERLNREVRDAVPGSLRIEDLAGNAALQGPCLRFWPHDSAGRYLDINQAVSGATALRMTMVEPIASEMPQDNWWAIVNPIPYDDNTSLWSNCAAGNCVSKIITEEGTVSGATSLLLDKPFAAHSSGRRVFFSHSQVLYCLKGAELRRAQSVLNQPDKFSLNPDDLSLSSSTGELMANNLKNGLFYREKNAFAADAEVGLRFNMMSSDELVTLDHKMVVWNAP